MPDAALALAPRAEAEGVAVAATAGEDVVAPPAPASPEAARSDRDSEDGSEEESEEEDFDERDPPRFLTVARVTSSSAALQWEADPDGDVEPSADAKAAAAAAGVVEKPARKRPAFVLQHATDSIWAAWGDPIVCFANEVRLTELAASSDFVVRVARCLSSAAGAPENSDEDMLVRFVVARSCGAYFPSLTRHARLAPSSSSPPAARDSEWSDSVRFTTHSAEADAVADGDLEGGAPSSAPPTQAADSGAPLSGLVDDAEGALGDVLESVAGATVAGWSSMYDAVGTGLSYAGQRASALVDSAMVAVDSVAGTVVDTVGSAVGAEEVEVEEDADDDGAAGEEEEDVGDKGEGGGGRPCGASCAGRRSGGGRTRIAGGGGTG